MLGAKDAPVQFFLQEAGAPCDAGAADAAGEVAEQAAGDAGVVEDGDAGGFGTGGVEAGDGAVAGAFADFLGIVQVVEEDGAVVVVVALHVGAAPASAVAEIEWLVPTRRPAKPAEVTRTTSVRP